MILVKLSLENKDKQDNLISRDGRFKPCKTYVFLWNKNNLWLPTVKRNSGKQRLEYHAIKDWNTINEDVRSADNVQQFESKFFKYINNLSFFRSSNIYFFYFYTQQFLTFLS